MNENRRSQRRIVSDFLSGESVDIYLEVLTGFKSEHDSPFPLVQGANKPTVRDVVLAHLFGDLSGCYRLLQITQRKIKLSHLEEIATALENVSLSSGWIVPINQGSIRVRLLAELFKLQPQRGFFITCPDKIGDVIKPLGHVAFKDIVETNTVEGFMGHVEPILKLFARIGISSILSTEKPTLANTRALLLNEDGTAMFHGVGGVIIGGYFDDKEIAVIEKILQMYLPLAPKLLTEINAHFDSYLSGHQIAMAGSLLILEEYYDFVIKSVAGAATFSTAFDQTIVTKKKWGDLLATAKEIGKKHNKCHVHLEEFKRKVKEAQTRPPV